MAENRARYGVAGAGIMNAILGIILAIIGMVIAIYFIAYTLPAALTTLSTASFTSVNGGVIAIFQTVIPITVGFLFVLAFLGLIRHIFTGV